MFLNQEKISDIAAGVREATPNEAKLMAQMLNTLLQSDYTLVVRETLITMNEVQA